MAGTLDEAVAALTAQVSATVGIEDSADLFIESVPGLIAAAVAQAQAAGATPAQLQAITDLGAALDAGTAKLKAAMDANPGPPIMGTKR